MRGLLRVSYDPEVHGYAFILSEAKTAQTVEVEIEGGSLFLDYDEDGMVVSIEFLDSYGDS